MTSYTTAKDVRALMKLEDDDDPTDGTITALIRGVSAQIDAELGAQDSSDEMVKLLAKLMTAVLIASADPHSIAIGNLRVDSYPVAQWNRIIDRIYIHYGLLGEKCGPRVAAWDER